VSEFFWPSQLDVVRTTINALIGTWRLVSWESRAGTAVISRPFGEKPVGVLTYDAKGRMSAQLMRRDRPAFKSGDWFRGSPDEIKAAFEGFLAYFGTYTVDERARTVTHHVEASSFPNFVRADLKRTFSFSGNRLTLRTEPWALGGQMETGVLVWERMD
jgi:hypothetical protein